MDDFTFDDEDLENMPKTKSKKTKAASRRLPLRSGIKKAKVSETISIEDDPEQKSFSSPIPAVPISEVVSIESLREVYERARQSYDSTMKVIPISY